MIRVVGLDPGTVTIDACGLEDGRVVLDRSWPTAEVVADPAAFVAALAALGPLDCVAGLSGYGLPLVEAARATDDELRLAVLAAAGEDGGIGGLRNLVRRLAAAGVPLVLLPGVIHLDTVPAHRKLNRIDLGTADKLAATALALHEQSVRRNGAPMDANFILLELGGAFTAAVAVEDGRIVDGIGGTSGPIGWRAAGAWDGEVAYLAGHVEKAMLFRGGVTTSATDEIAVTPASMAAYAEGAAKTVAQLLVSAPRAREIFLSGRHAADPAIAGRLADLLGFTRPITRLAGFAAVAKQGAQGAALIADGLAGGSHRVLVESLRLRHAAGTVLDHLRVVDPAAARRRIGLGT